MAREWYRRSSFASRCADLATSCSALLFMSNTMCTVMDEGITVATAVAVLSQDLSAAAARSGGGRCSFSAGLEERVGVRADIAPGWYAAAS